MNATLSVLAVDDDLSQRVLLEAQLTEVGLTVQTVASMHDALELLAGAPESIDVVVVDLGLPDTDGLESLAMALQGCSAPVVVRSASVEPGVHDAALDMGAAAFVAKDADPGPLIDAVRRAGASTRLHLPPLPSASIGTSQSGGFEQTVRRTLEFLAQVAPLGVWLFTRVDGTDQVVLDAEGDAFGVRPGDVLPWADSLCQRMTHGEGPLLTDRAAEVPAYRDQPAVSALGVETYCGWPVSVDGRLFGTLCGYDPSSRTDTVTAAGPLLAYAGRMLSAALAADLDRDRLQRRLDLARMASRTDSLTGLANRRAFDLVVRIEDARARRYGHTAGIVVIDLNDLKTLNDTEGHRAGDLLLGRTSQTLLTTIRDSDSAFRLGGDEFAVIAIPSGPTEIATLEQRVRDAMAEAGISAAVGSALGQRGASLSEALVLADQRMYADKAALRPPVRPQRT